MKRQIVVIHGGDSFKTRGAYFKFLKARRIDFKRYLTEKSDWKRNLRKTLGKDYEVISPDMPSPRNAMYMEWKIWLEKFIPYLKPGAVLVGHSLGGLFLAKYLSENKFPKKIRALFLVAASPGNGNFTPPKNFRKIEDQAGKIFLYHSIDDPVVPFADFKEYRRNLKSATSEIFRDRGHFNQEKFPELVKDIRDLY